MAAQRSKLGKTYKRIGTIMKTRSLINLSLLNVLALWALTVPVFSEENKIPLEQVPAPVIKKAKEEVPGITLLEAEMEEEDGITVYELEGVLEDYEYEIEISKDGNLLELKKVKRKENE